MLVDGHMHLEYGKLSVAYVLEFVEAAQAKGIDKIQILDHTHRFKEFSPIYDNLRTIPVQKQWLANPKLKFKNSLAEYWDLIQQVKSLDLPIEVSFGLEVCYVPEYEDKIREILKPYQFDFLVGAVHSIDGILYDMSFSKEILWDKYATNQIYKRYYELLFEVVKSNLFTQLAHPDTIKLFNYYPDYDLQPTYDELAELCKQHHVLAECNTGCHYRYNHKDIGLSDDLLQTFVKHNVQLITASDAHQPKHVGNYILEASERIATLKRK